MTCDQFGPLILKYTMVRDVVAHVKMHLPGQANTSETHSSIRKNGDDLNRNVLVAVGRIRQHL